MKFFSRSNNNCEFCKVKLESYSDLISHVRHEHHKTIVKCSGCGKEFIHEKDRLLHEREERERKVKNRYR
ncbi:MAG: hypothetical protein ACT4OD_00475 [Candidatus Nitrosotenuis sp.]